MEILNQIEHLKLGCISCIADENGYPYEWSKIQSIKIFLKEFKDIKISFNLFCFDKNFEVNEAFKDISKITEESLVKYYNKFFNDRDEIEHVFNKWYIENVKPILEGEGISQSIEEAYKLIKIIEVRIFTDGYAIIFETPWHDELLGIEKKFFEDGEEEMYMQLECDIEVVEMDYN